jgi:hypothetical protein
MKTFRLASAPVLVALLTPLAPLACGSIVDVAGTVGVDAGTDVGIGAVDGGADGTADSSADAAPALPETLPEAPYAEDAARTTSAATWTAQTLVTGKVAVVSFELVGDTVIARMADNRTSRVIPLLGREPAQVALLDGVSVDGEFVTASPDRSALLFRTPTGLAVWKVDGDTVAQVFATTVPSFDYPCAIGDDLRWWATTGGDVLAYDGSRRPTATRLFPNGFALGPDGRLRDEHDVVIADLGDAIVAAIGGNQMLAAPRNASTSEIWTLAPYKKQATLPIGTASPWMPIANWADELFVDHTRYRIAPDGTFTAVAQPAASPRLSIGVLRGVVAGAAIPFGGLVEAGAEDYTMGGPKTTRPTLRVAPFTPGATVAFLGGLPLSQGEDGLVLWNRSGTQVLQHLGFAVGRTPSSAGGAPSKGQLATADGAVEVAACRTRPIGRWECRRGYFTYDRSQARLVASDQQTQERAYGDTAWNWSFLDGASSPARRFPAGEDTSTTPSRGHRLHGVCREDWVDGAWVPSKACIDPDGGRPLLSGLRAITFGDAGAVAHLPKADGTYEARPFFAKPITRAAFDGRRALLVDEAENLRFFEETAGEFTEVVVRPAPGVASIALDREQALAGFTSGAVVVFQP